MRWLLRWQHVAPGTQLLGERGTLEVLQQMQGFEAPANAWERQILARRIADYDPKVLDHLSLTGAIGWGRLSPHPATLETHGQRAAAGDSHQRRADHLFRARRCGLDDSTPGTGRARNAWLELPRQLLCCSICGSAALRFSPTSFAPPGN